MTILRLVAMFGMVALIACDDPSGPTLDGPPFVTAIVDGEPWTVDTSGSLHSVLSGDTVLNVFARKLDASGKIQESIEFSIHRVDTVGIYILSYDRNPLNVGRYVIYSPSGEDARTFATVRGRTGFVHVTAFNPGSRAIAGTFGFEGLLLALEEGPVVVVSGGEFRVTY